MANTDQPMGFRPINPNARITYYKLSSSNSEILRFAPVVKDSGGHITNATAGNGAGSVIGISAEYKAASDGGWIGVWDDPEEIFLCQEDGDGTTSAQTHAGNNADFISTHTSNNGVDSATELDISTVATTSTLQFRILDLAERTDLEAGEDNAWGAHAKLLVRINAHHHTYTTGQ